MYSDRRNRIHRFVRGPGTREHGHHVTILARNRNKVPALNKISALEIVPGDITDRKLLEELVAERMPASWCVELHQETGWEVLLDDTLPTVFLSDAAAQAKVKHFIYTSSTAANDSLYMAHATSREGSQKRHRHHKAASGNVLWRDEGGQRKFCHRAVSCSPMRVNIIRRATCLEIPWSRVAAFRATRVFATS